MDKSAVINASPLIFLSRGQQLKLLRHFASRILVPEPVANEILKKGPGESSVLAFAHENPRMEAIIDDLAGRKCPDHLNIPVRGTLGIVLAAKKRGLIRKARPVMETLIRSGLYLSRPVLDEALRRVDE